MTFSRSAVVRNLRTKTLHRLSRAELISKDGFSVVAPIRMILPRSTKGKKASCWALLKRWISSMKQMVRSPYSRFCSASCMSLRISLMLLVTAEKVTKWALVCWAMISARVVLPTPGGPQKINEESWSFSISSRRTRWGPIRCCWPTNSARVLGRTRLASGVAPELLWANNDS